MMSDGIPAWLVTAGLLAFHISFVVRAILRPRREPVSRLARVVVILILPVLGITGHFLLGEADIGRRREWLRALLARLEVALIASANMDRRSFDLNCENDILLSDNTVTATLRERQELFLKTSHPLTAASVAAWPVHQRLVNNTVAMLGPVR